MVTIHDVAIDEIIVREMNDEEYADWESRLAIQEIEKAKEADKAAARVLAEAKLAALGLTTDDLKALGL
jgi:hypothetical protein